MKKVLNVVKTIGYKVAKGTANSASLCYLNQPKEPKNLAERLAKMSK